MLTFIVLMLSEFNTMPIFGTLPTLPLLTLFVLCLKHVLSSRDFTVLGMVQYVVDYSYLLSYLNMKTTVVKTTRVASLGRSKDTEFPAYREVYMK